MPAQDIGPTWGDWADAAFGAESDTKSSVISHTDSEPDLTRSEDIYVGRNLLPNKCFELSAVSAVITDLSERSFLNDVDGCYYVGTDASAPIR